MLAKAQPVAPRVSVCIPTYNRRAMLRAALWSVINQTYRNIEVIVSDNASEDDIGAEAAAANDPRVRCVRQSVNLGATGNFVALQTHATGDYVLFLGSDDLLVPNCLEKAVAMLDAHPDRGGVVFQAGIFGPGAARTISDMPTRAFAAADEYRRDRAVRDFRHPGPSVCLYRRSAFERLGGWDRKLLAVIDYDMYAKVVRFGGGIIFLHEPLGIARRHDTQHSGTAHWDFYHDVMLMSAKAEYPWGNAYRAMAFLEQLLWDWRLRISPLRTLSHAAKTGAFPGILPYLPFEIGRRLLRRLGTIAWGRGLAASGAQAFNSVPRDQLAELEKFWLASERIRLGQPSP